MSGNRFDKDFYGVLGVAQNASGDEIKRAYRKLARKHHPDRNPGDKAAEETMKKISEAHDVLSDTSKRGEYDQGRKMARSGGFRAPGGPGGQGGFRVEGADGFDLGSIFGSLFTGAGGRRGAGRAAPAGPDLQASARISFADAMNGVTVSVSVPRDVACATCGGSGAAPGSTPVVCATCSGAGVVEDNQGPFAFQRHCSACGGSGRIVANPCSGCAGEGSVRRLDEVKIKVPVGVADGAKIRARGYGGAGPAGGRPGDLMVIVRVDAHAVFGRTGADLTLELPVTYAEAALGAQVAVPTLEGAVTLKVPAGTQSGRTFRVRGRGAPQAKGARGDLLATVRVVVPQEITGTERELLEAMKAQQNDSIRSHLGL